MQSAMSLRGDSSWASFVPNSDRAVNLLQQPGWAREQQWFKRTYTSSMAHQHQKLRIICQVLDERLVAWSPVARTVTKNLL